MKRRSFIQAIFAFFLGTHLPKTISFSSPKCDAWDWYHNGTEWVHRARNEATQEWSYEKPLGHDKIPPIHKSTYVWPSGTASKTHRD